MQELKVIGVENGALLVASDDGERFRIVIDEALQSRLRQAKPEPTNGQKLSPREVQALHPLRHVRGGRRSGHRRVAGYIQRFEGPVVAEREHMVTWRWACPCTRPSTPTGRRRLELRRRHPRPPRSLGARRALGELEGTGRRLGRQARLHRRRDRPRRALGLRAQEARALAAQQRGDHALPAGRDRGSLIPRLRAVGPDDPIDSPASTAAPSPSAIR